MSETKGPEMAQIFCAQTRRRKRARAHARLGGQMSFLHQRCAEDLAERLQDINRTFESALIIAPPGFSEGLLTRLPEAKHPKSIIRAYDIDTAGPAIDVAAQDDALPFEAGRFDLVISVLSLHSVNDLPGALMNARHILVPDGLFIGAVFGGESLSEFRSALYAAEQNALGGVSPRVFSMIDFSQAAALLQRAGLALPVVDTDRFCVNYSAFSRLLADLRDAGESNSLIARSRLALPRRVYQQIEPRIKKRLKITYEIVWLTGWAPHKNQQKPLKPGSAKMRLAEALGTKEKKL